MAFSYTLVHDGANLKSWEITATADADRLVAFDYVDEGGTDFLPVTPDAGEDFLVFLTPRTAAGSISKWTQNGPSTAIRTSALKRTSAGSGDPGPQCRIDIVRVPAPVFG